MLKVYVDGACEPINPGGTASYGMVVYRDSEKIFERAKIIGSGDGYSNNVAEYAGLLEFLKLWHANEPATIYSDSQLMVYQMSGKWQARKGMYVDSYLKAKELSRGKPITFEWIPREKNTEADKLSTTVLLNAGVKVMDRSHALVTK